MEKALSLYVFNINLDILYLAVPVIVNQSTVNQISACSICRLGHPLNLSRLTLAFDLLSFFSVCAEAKQFVSFQQAPGLS